MADYSDKYFHITPVEWGILGISCFPLTRCFSASHRFPAASCHTPSCPASARCVVAKSIFPLGIKTNNHKVPILTSLLSSLHHRQKEHFVFIFDYVVKLMLALKQMIALKLKTSFIPKNKNKRSSSCVSLDRNSFYSQFFSFSYKAEKAKNQPLGWVQNCLLHPTKNTVNGQGAENSHRCAGQGWQAKTGHISSQLLQHN